MFLVQRIVNKLKKGIVATEYFAKRGGFLYFCCLLLCDRGVLNREHINGTKWITYKFYKYFETLDKSQYYDELIQQLPFIYGGIGKDYNILNPMTYNEKIQWIKAFGMTPVMSTLADKYAVRDWVSKKIGDDYLIPLVGGPWKKAEDIDFESLPDKYVLKANHGSGMNFVVNNGETANRSQIKNKAHDWLNTLFGWMGMESQYFSISKCVIAEKYMEQSDGNLYDYKVFCFDGCAKFIRVHGDRNLEKHTGKQAFLDTDWKLMDFSPGDYPDFEHEIPRPSKLKELVDVAEKLAQGFSQVRVDLYIIDEHIYFGEMTFTPFCGFFPWKPAIADREVGAFFECKS